MDDPLPVDTHYNIRQRDDLNLSRIDPRDHSRNTDSVLACGQEPTRVSSPALLSDHQALNVSETPGRRGMDVSQPLTELQANLPELNRDYIISNPTEPWMTIMKTSQDRYEEQLGRLQANIVSINITMQSTEASHRELQQAVNHLEGNYSEVFKRLNTDGVRLDNLDKIISRVENKVAENLETVQEWFVDLTARPSAEIPREIINSIQDVINDSSPGLAVDRLREEIRDLRDSLSTSQYVTEGLRGLVVYLSDQVSNSSVPQIVLDENLSGRDNLSIETSRRECEIVKKGIERTEKQLRQLILNDIQTESVDISLIKKYKTVDVPCVHSAIGNIQKSLQRYMKFSGVDSEYCDMINDLLDEAENWCLRIEVLYNKAEIHSINTSKGDTADVGIFSDNAKVTVYEFLEAAEIAYLGWGNSVQKANRLYNRHLSEEIKSKLINKSDSYAEMKQWLISNYGGVSRIINDVISDLSRRCKPASTNSQGKFTFYAHISGAMQRLERLSKMDGISTMELETCLVSRSTLSSFSLILLSETYTDWISEMTKAGMDYKNPEGIGAYTVFKNLCIIERNKSEGSRIPDKVSSPKMKPRSPRTKPKSVHKVADMIEDELEEMHDTSAFATSYHNTKWYPANLKFPCPLSGHKHELSTCQEFFSFNPIERWEKMDKGKLCYACLSPKDVCTDRKCGFESKVPETLKCQGCAPWARSRKLAPFSILFCRIKDHAKLRASFLDMKRELEKYIGKLGTTVVDSSIKFAANYMCQVFSLNPGGANALGWVQEDFKDKPAPSIDSEFVESAKIPSESIVPKFLEHSCYLMQTIKIGNSEVLVFFDRGANIHIIDGSLAEKEGLQRVSSNPTCLTVVGGNRVKSNHGTFRFNLGPGDNGEFHEVVCVGMSDVTAGFGSYDLSEIAEEYRNQAEGEKKNVVLPERVGGSRVHLLLGIKNTNLDPVLVKILPSGVAV